LSTSTAGLAALQAAIAAGQASGLNSVANAAFPVLTGEADLRGLQATSLSLLWRIRCYLPSVTPVVLQFVPCAVQDVADSVACAFARATAATLGRTLLINAREIASAQILPDAFTPRLYHQNLSGAGLYARLAQVGAAVLQNGSLTMFRFLIINHASPLSGDGVCAAAPFCTGTILVVRAGVTDLACIKSAAGRIASIGGTVLGTVLTDAPAWAALA
jgi:hypothetical protein